MKTAGKKARNVSNNVTNNATKAENLDSNIAKLANNVVHHVVYTPVIVRGVKSICSTFGLPREEIRDAIKNGAPIYVGARGEYFCETMQLFSWLSKHKNSRD